MSNHPMGDTAGNHQKAAVMRMGESQGPGRPPESPDGSATSHIHIRTTPRRKAAYVRKAKPGKLTDWIVDTLDHAAGYSPNSGSHDQNAL